MSLATRLGRAVVGAAARAVFGAPRRMTPHDALLVACDAMGRQVFTSRRNEPDAGEVLRVAILSDSPRQSIIFDFDGEGRRLLTLRVFKDGGFNATL